METQPQPRRLKLGTPVQSYMEVQPQNLAAVAKELHVYDPTRPGPIYQLWLSLFSLSLLSTELDLRAHLAVS